MKHLEKQFRIGMCWKNYGVKWELDHIIPVSYVLKDEFKTLGEEKKLVVKGKICHFSNIQPLFNHENAKKRDHLTAEARQILDLLLKGTN